MKNASLTVVGSGIKFMSHMTIEVKTHIENAEKILYLVNEPAIRNWLHECNPSAESLDSAYMKYALRTDAYQSMTNTIMEHLRLKQHVCVVLEGHPVVFAKPALDAILQAKTEGFDAVILPGISAEDYLFADLCVDPGSVGCQSYEATDFLINRRAFDGYSHLILWQISVIGLFNYAQHHDHKKNTAYLVEYLNHCYPLDHEVILYEGSQYPHIPSTIRKIHLNDLPNTTISRITTLYVPPCRKRISDQFILNNIKIL